MQRWRPDTCGCVVLEDYDTQGNKYCCGVEHKCEAHKNVPDDALYGILYANHDGENKVKNKVLQELLDEGETEPFGISEEDVGKDGRPFKRIKKGCKCSLTFTGEGSERVLEVDVELESHHKDCLNAHCENSFPGRVRVK